MLLRELQEIFRDHEHQPAVAPLMRHLPSAQRFILREHASRAVDDISRNVGALSKARDQIFAPFPVTWVEMDLTGENITAGFLWIGEGDDPRKGTCWFVSHDKDRGGVTLPKALVCDFQADSPLRIKRGNERRWVTADGLPFDTTALIGIYGALLMSAFAVIASNGVTHTVEADMSKLNAARHKRGLWPLMSYKEIKLTVDAERIVTASRGTATGAMPQHPVRAHLMLCPSGKVTIRRAHMRGDPKNGIRHHHYTVQTSDDLVA